MAPRMTLDLDEHVVAVLVLALGVIAFQAYALDDVELAIALAEPDAGRLIRLLQHVRCINHDVEMQLTGCGQLDALDDFDVAVIGNAGRLAHREHGLRLDIDSLYDQGIALPPANRVAVKGQFAIVRMAAAVGIDAAQAV